MSKFLAIAAVAAITALAGTAQAAQVCGATTHSRFGETRARFGAVLAACRPGGYCSVVSTIASEGGSAYAQQFRIARPRPGADHQVELTAVEPLPNRSARGMSLTFMGQRMNLARIARLTDNSANVFRITDGIAAKSIVSNARRQSVVRWTYASSGGSTDAYFSMIGVNRALNWIDCMGERRGRSTARG